MGATQKAWFRSKGALAGPFQSSVVLQYKDLFPWQLAKPLSSQPGLAVLGHFECAPSWGQALFSDAWCPIGGAGILYASLMGLMAFCAWWRGMFLTKMLCIACSVL